MKINSLMPLAAVAVLPVGIWLGGCADTMPADHDADDEPSAEAEQAELEQSDDETSEAAARGAPLVDLETAMQLKEQVADAHETTGPEEQPQLGEQSVPEEEDLEFTIAEQDVSDAHLYVDEDAEELEILDIELEEGRRQHYVSVTCHDPEVDNTRWRRGHGRVSQRCEVDLSTAASAVRVDPNVNFRIAPTPRGFRILGDFEQGDYDLEIAAGLRTEDGAYLHEDEEESIDVPELSEALSFLAEGRYLPRSAWEELNFQHRNVEQVDLEVRHVPRENLAFWLSRPSERVDERTSTVVVDTEIPVRQREDEMLTSSVAIDQHLEDPQPGLYEMTIRSDDDRAVGRLQVTDINLITKRNEADPDSPWEDHIDVWAVDMETTEPMSNVSVETIRPSGQAMARCRTDAEGHCRLELPDDDVDPTPPMGIIAERGSDLTYLTFEDLEIESGIDAADGPAYREEQSYLATMYGDRDLYRPGDQVNVMGALRDVDYTSADPGIPAEVTVEDPQGDVVVERTLDTDEVGTFDFDFPLSDVAPTGRYTTTLEVGTRQIETYSFHVEEFVPERMEVQVEPTEEVFTADERAEFEVEAQYLFGAGAEGSEVELDCRMVPIDSPLADGDYEFGPVEIEESRDIIDFSTRHGVIGEDNTTEIACPRLDRAPEGPMRVEATVAVAEGGSGRTTHGAGDALMQPDDYQIGLRTDADELRTGDELTVHGQLVDPEGERADVDEEVTLEFYNIRRHRSWQRNARGRWNVSYDYQLVLERSLYAQPEEGRFTATTTAADVSHAYLVRADLGEATTELHIDGRRRFRGFSRRGNRTPQPRNPSEVTIEAPAEVPIGEETTIQYTAPFAGRALMTVETDEIIEQQWVEAREGDNTWSFSVDTDEPNVYVGAFIIRDPREASELAFNPERAFGATSVPVERSRVETEVAVDTPEEIRPNNQLDIDIEAPGAAGADSAIATVAAVDEGILQLTNYTTPDPLDAMWNERAPGVTTFDTIGWATRLPPANPSSRTGGGAPAEEEASKDRIMPFEPIAMWSGPVELDAQGRATVQFDIPQYSGRLRVMSAVFTPDQMGAAEQDVVVRDPLTVQTTFPRQLAEDDVADIPVFVNNLTDEPREIDVDIHAEPVGGEGFDAAFDGYDDDIVEFPEGSSRTVELDPGASEAIYIPARATVPGGGAQMTVEIGDDEHESFDTGTIPFQPRGDTQRRTHTVELHEGTTDLTEYLEGWVPTTEQSTFFASALSEPEAFEHLEYLVTYPFGCAEQTMSRARPLVLLPEVVENIDPQFAAGGDGLDDKIDHGINRMLSMQNSDGSVGLWPSSSGSASVTAQLLDLFVQARDQGYDVPEDRIESATEWLADNVSGTKSDALEHYMLARAGEPETSDIREAIDDLPESPEGRDRERAYLLYAALYLAGDRSYEQELRNPEFETGDGGRSQGRFYSHSRQRAMVLNVYTELFGRGGDIEPLVRAVTDDLLSTRYGKATTQELVWGLEGLVRWYDFDGLDDADIELLADGRNLQSHRANRAPTWSVHRASEFDRVELAVDFNGQDLDDDQLPSLLINSRGVHEEPIDEGDGEGLAIERTYLDEDGEPIAEDEISPGDVVYAKVQLENETDTRQRDLAVVDRLPAALEVENPDLGAAELPSWADDGWDTDHVDIRDDQVEMFGELSSGESVEMVYPTRATMSGEFYVPAPDVEGMYNPDVWARGEDGELTVQSVPES